MMSEQLPEAYAKYLAGCEPTQADAILPVLKQSAAEGDRGVLVRFLPNEVQAMLPRRSRSEPSGKNATTNNHPAAPAAGSPGCRRHPGLPPVKAQA